MTEFQIGDTVIIKFIYSQKFNNQIGVIIHAEKYMSADRWYLVKIITGSQIWLRIDNLESVGNTS